MTTWSSLFLYSLLVCEWHNWQMRSRPMSIFSFFYVMQPLKHGKDNTNAILRYSESKTISSLVSRYRYINLLPRPRCILCRPTKLLILTCFEVTSSSRSQACTQKNTKPKRKTENADPNLEKPKAIKAETKRQTVQTRNPVRRPTLSGRPLAQPTIGDY